MSGSLVAFINQFLSYMLVFVVAVAVILAATFIGIALRKGKNKKEEKVVETTEE